MKNTRTTLKQLAAELNLSVTTVSRALGGYSDVAATTRDRVVYAAGRAGYVPNSGGRMLVTGRSRFVGFQLPIRQSQPPYPILAELITQLTESMTDLGLDLVLIKPPNDPMDIANLERVVQSGRIDGIILTRPIENDARARYLALQQFPFVTYGRVPALTVPYSWYDTDGYTAYEDAFRLLYNLGHRRFGFVFMEEPLSFKYYRERGLDHALSQQGDGKVNLVKVKIPWLDTHSRNEAIAQMLAKPDRPTAVLAVTDEIAWSVVTEARKVGIAIPNQLSVIGFDNSSTTQVRSLGLTTYDQSVRNSAANIANLLALQLNQESHCDNRLFVPQLVNRSSHGPAPTEQ